MDTAQPREKNSVILRRAKDIIKVDGWTTGGEGMRVNGPVCIEGAVARAAADIHPRPYHNDIILRYLEEDVQAHPAGVALAECLREKGWVYPDQQLWSWNDLLRTAGPVAATEKVIEALNDCANREEEAGR